MTSEPPLALVGVRATNSPNFVQTVFDVYEAGKVSVILKGDDDQGLPIEREVAPTNGSGWFRPRHAPSHSEAPAHIVFTSGTQSAPKAMAISHRSLADVVERLNNLMALTSQVREYVGVPVTYSFGIGRCRAVAAVGGACYLPPAGFDPHEIRTMLKQGEINAISAVPTLWRLLLEAPRVLGDSGQAVRWIEIGSQYMSGEEKDALRRIFPNANIVQHYGLTEASRTTLLQVSSEHPSKLESVGRAIGATEVRLDAEGRIQIRGPHVALGYLVGGKAVPVTDDEGWLTTSDLGRLEDGYLYFEGRADDVVNCGGVKVHPDSVERYIRLHLGEVTGVAVAGVPDHARGEAFGVFVEEAVELPRDRIIELTRDHLASCGVTASDAVQLHVVSSLPRTETGKVKRRLLASAIVLEPKARDSVHSVSHVFRRIFPGAKLNDNDTFRSLGGDSLNYVRAAIDLEKALGSVPPGWDALTIGELEALGAGARVQRIETNVFLRALAILSVVIGHSGLEAVSGGTLLLVVLVGYNLARFQSGKILAGAVFGTLGRYVGKLSLAYYMLALPYLAYKGILHWGMILMISNWVKPGAPAIFPAWFLQMLVQSIVIVGLLFAIPKLRSWLQKDLWLHSFVILMCLYALSRIVPLFWDTNYLYQRVPHTFLPVLWLGWCVFFATNVRHKLLLSVAAMVFSLPHLRSHWIAVGALPLIWVPAIPVPGFVRTATRMIAAATFYLFLCHGLFLHVTREILEITNPIVHAVVSVSGCVTVWWVVEEASLLDRVRAIPARVRAAVASRS